jgi:ferric-dicitrate binding protein FerR (iron transport regulator)
VILAASVDRIIGQVAVTGEGRILLDSGKWSKIDKVYPVTDNSRFKTKKGRMSFVFKDSTRLEVGDSSEVVIKGKVGSYVVEVVAGKVIFSVPEGTVMIIKTPDLVGEIKSSKKMIQKVSATENTTIVGVLYDGKRTKVVTFSGQINIKTSSGETMMRLTAGKGVEVSSTDSNIKVVQVQAIGAETLALTGEKFANTLFYILAGAAAVGYVILSEEDVSPSAP